MYAAAFSSSGDPVSRPRGGVLGRPCGRETKTRLKESPIVSTATLTDYRFNEGVRPSGLGEFRIVVSPSADRVDSLRWAGVHAAPLTSAESLGWKRDNDYYRYLMPL